MRAYQRKLTAANGSGHGCQCRPIQPCMCVRLLTTGLTLCVSCLQIYVFCCAHAAQVEAYLQQAHWLSERHCKVRPVPALFTRHQALHSCCELSSVVCGSSESV